MDSKIFLGKYRVVAGEMESVGEIADGPLAYEAEEIDSGKKMTVEVIPAASLEAAVRERLEAEAAAAKKLIHVNIPALYDFGVEDDHLVYVTEGFEGTPAEEWVNAHGPMPVGPVLRIASQVVSALGVAAVHRINHHALNPANLVLAPGQTAEGEWPLIKVLHFVGVVPTLSGTDTVAAFDKSLHYVSPEQIQKGTVDFRSELYSLGATMWFLLTGTPPLVAAAGPTAVGPAKTAVVAEKIDAVPRKVRRLLSQMLSPNPEARPSDPLAFYRQLQDCLHQVERRETMSRAFGIPVPAPVPALSHLSRRFSTKALVLAALFLALATVGALVLNGYLRHRRIVRSEEPIGKPIGVPEASASATPLTANTNAPPTGATPPGTVMADSANVRSTPPANVAPIASAQPAIVSKEIAPLPSAPPAISDSPKDPRSQEHPPVVANKASDSPAALDSREVASSKPTDPTPRESAAPEAGVVAKKTEPEKSRMPEVRRAEPADDEPEVRRAEPAPADEGPESAASETTASDLESRAPEKSPAKKPEQAAKPKRPVERKDSRRERPSESPAGARFLGLTPEGWRILELPSGEIIVVPPRR